MWKYTYLFNLCYARKITITENQFFLMYTFFLIYMYIHTYMRNQINQLRCIKSYIYLKLLPTCWPLMVATGIPEACVDSIVAVIWPGTLGGRVRWPGVDTGAGAITRLGMVVFKADWNKEKSDVGKHGHAFFSTLVYFWQEGSSL